jgi:uncharacterized membrane protein YhaH (DUF805 family)
MSQTGADGRRHGWFRRLFRGRSSCPTFLLTAIGVTILVAGAQVLGLMAAMSAGYMEKDDPAGILLGVGGSALLIGAGLVWLGLMPATVRRLHDLGLSGRLAMPFSAGLLYYGNGFTIIDLIELRPDVWLASGGLDWPAVVHWVGALLLVLACLVLACWPGTKGANRYGPPPASNRVA